MNEKTALITGGATGIGKRTAVELAEKGIHLIINYRNSEEQAVGLAKQLTEKYGTKNMAIKGDVSKNSECELLVAKASRFSESVDIVVHNAGPYIHERKKMADYAPEEWEYLIGGNLNAVFYLSRLILPKMRARKWGRIITVGFDRAESAPGWIYRSAFAAAKTGLASLTKTIALEEAEYGITANMVCPGDIAGIWKEKEIEDAFDAADSASPVGRPGTGEDIARVVSFLINEKSQIKTGP